MEYQVPQFIEVEDKIFGPFTFKQFVYVAGGVGMCAIAVFYLPLFLAILVCLPIAGFAGALAFYKVNNRPFEDVLESAFNYYILGSRLYLWRKEPNADKGVQQKLDANPIPATPVRPGIELTRGKLHDLAWSLDIQERQPPEA